MKISALLTCAASAAAVASVSVYAATPAAGPPPVATYWMDVSTMSGLGAAFMGGGRPSAAAMMGMMGGRGGSSVAHMMELRLSSRQRPAGAPEANHFIPAGMEMGPSLPLVAPQMERVQPTGGSDGGSYERPKGRMLIYWGCGEHAGAGQPTIIDFARMAAGQIPPGFEALARMGRAMGRMSAHAPRPENSAAFGEWPNSRDSRPVPASASLVGAHRVQANYAPAIAFSLSQGQDFMPGLGLREAGSTPAGGDRLVWTPAAQATGYALAMFGQSGSGDTVIWTSARSASMAPAFDFESPAEVRRLIAAGGALPPTANECVLPAEVSRAVPQGMVMMVGYGPEAYFSDKPHAPTWTTRVRFKTTAMVMRGMGDMDSGDQDSQQDPDAQPQPQPKKKRHGIGLGDILGGVPHP